MIMGNNKDDAQKTDCQQRVKSVIDSLKKKISPLTAQQENFCNEECVERFLKAKGGNVKKAAKQLSHCLSWRDSFGIDNLIADEFCAELGEGVAYVAGHDDELRPVMIFRIKQDYQKQHSQKWDRFEKSTANLIFAVGVALTAKSQFHWSCRFTRLVVFTLEVAIQTMATNVHQFVLLFDGSLFRSSTAIINMLLATLKIIADNYPLRLHKAFVIDPPSLFSYLWKGVRPFVELSSLIAMISSIDFEESLQFSNFTTLSYSRSTSRRFDQSSIPSAAKLGSCSSSRFTFTVSHHFDTLKPWYLSLTDTSEAKLDRTNNIPHTFLGPSISPLDARYRSLSFSSPMSRKGFFPSTPMPQKTQKPDPSMIRHTRTPKPSFLHSPAVFFRKDYQPRGADQKSHESFIPFLKLYRQPYDEMVYRSKMRPPLGGLIPIVSSQLKRRHISRSQRF